MARSHRPILALLATALTFSGLFAAPPMPVEAAPTIRVGSTTDNGRWIITAIDPSPAVVNQQLTAEFNRWRKPGSAALAKTPSSSGNSALCQSRAMARNWSLKHNTCPPAPIPAAYHNSGEVIAYSQYPVGRVANPINDWYHSKPHRDIMWDAGTRAIDFASVCKNGRLWSTARTNGVRQDGHVAFRAGDIKVNNMNVALSCSGNRLLLWSNAAAHAEGAGVAGKVVKSGRFVARTGSTRSTATVQPGCKFVRPNAQFASKVRSHTGAQIWRLYASVLHRNPDLGGFNYWIRQRNRGVSLELIAYQFVNSTEFTNRYGHLNNEQFVDRIYANVFCRLADAGGRAYWINHLNRGMSQHRFLTSITESPEYRTATGTR